MTCLAKSPNKQNRLWCVARPLDNQLGLDIESGKIGPKCNDEKKVQIRRFVKEYGWDKNQAGRIWDFGLSSPNILIDDTKGVQYL